MLEDFKKRIRVKNVQINMCLAEDVLTPSGQILIPEGSIVTDKCLFRLNLYQISSVVIDCSSSSDLYDPTEMVESNEIPEEEMTLNGYNLHNKDTFNAFLKVYKPIEVMIQEQFSLICHKQAFDAKVLLKASDKLMNSVRLKSDLFTFMSALQGDNQHTFVHSVNVSMLCHIFGQWLKLSKDDIDQLTLAGMLHDIGKTLIDKEILSKEGPLSTEEFEEIRLHTQKGYDAISHLQLPKEVKDAVLLHHERNDGTGYPLSLEKHQIPDFAKIVAIVDVYEAMTSNRTYHQKFSPFRVIQLFEQESFGYLDSKFLNIFLENIAHNYLGEEVQLSDGTKGKIVFIHNQSPSRPIIQSGEDMIDLMSTPNLTIIEVI